MTLVQWSQVFKGWDIKSSAQEIRGGIRVIENNGFKGTSELKQERNNNGINKSLYCIPT